MATPQSATVGQALSGSISASALLKTGSGVLQKIVCSTSGTLVIYDNTAASGTVLIASFAVTAGNVYVLDLAFSTGCYISITSAVITPIFGP